MSWVAMITAVPDLFNSMNSRNSRRPSVGSTLPDGALMPSYSGIRPKIVPPAVATQDFLMQGPRDHGVAGLVNLFGQDISLLGKDQIADLRKRIGIVLQDFRLLDHMTTYENVALPFRVMGREESSYRREVIDLLKWVGLGERMDALPPILSGGEKQRAAIARAVIARPQLLLADEPTGNVDPNLAKRLLRLFMELNKSGTSVVIATHDIALMDQVDARRLVLHEGRLHVYD